jgi:REP element-mobilizing transposase RayT
VPFHITARVQRQEHLFADVEAAVVEVILQESDAAQIELLAFAVMPNHLHLVLVQAQAPLGRVMQPLLRRIALLIQRRHSRIGHIFERRFRSSPCFDPDYLRNSIAYVHLNPVRAGICPKPSDSSCTSHNWYCTGRPATAASLSGAALNSGLRLFAATPESTIDECRSAYLAFLSWRQAMDEFIRNGRPPEQCHPGFSPPAYGGDVHWRDNYSAVIQPPKELLVRRDLRDIVLDTLRREAPDMALDLIRSGSCNRRLVAVRRKVIAECVRGGYATVQIAAYLGISQSAVSLVAAPLRRRVPMSGSVSVI